VLVVEVTGTGVLVVEVTGTGVLVVVVPGTGVLVGVPVVVEVPIAMEKMWIPAMSPVAVGRVTLTAVLEGSRVSELKKT
jgi:hypothetical protein